ncbi:MAG: hypothetical protein LRY71_10045 [Bacillaceae bacterium]|nr:hypothetical protein [Bacillaceae bacterium]
MRKKKYIYHGDFLSNEEKLMEKLSKLAKEGWIVNLHAIPDCDFQIISDV